MFRELYTTEVSEILENLMKSFLKFKNLLPKYLDLATFSKNFNVLKNLLHGSVRFKKLMFNIPEIIASPFCFTRSMSKCYEIYFQTTFFPIRSQSHPLS